MVSCCCFLSSRIQPLLPANQPSDQRPHIGRGHPGRDQPRLRLACTPPPTEIAPPDDDIIRGLEPNL